MQGESGQGKVRQGQARSGAGCREMHPLWAIPPSRTSPFTSPGASQTCLLGLLWRFPLRGTIDDLIAVGY